MNYHKAVYTCPFRQGVECEANHKKPCLSCGWHYAEENRRKAIITRLRAMGQYNGSIKV